MEVLQVRPPFLQGPSFFKGGIFVELQGMFSCWDLKKNWMDMLELLMRNISGNWTTPWCPYFPHRKPVLGAGQLIDPLSWWPTFKLLGITHLVGKIEFELLFHGPKWQSKLKSIFSLEFLRRFSHEIGWVLGTSVPRSAPLKFSSEITPEKWRGPKRKGCLPTINFFGASC